MREFRCRKCRQLQFKYNVKGKKVIIETKCYSCNHFNYFTIWLSKLLRKTKEDEKNNKQI